MKQNITITKTIIAMIGFTFMLTSCSTWRYNKQQRVRIEAELIPSEDIQTDNRDMTTPSTILAEKETEQNLRNNTTTIYGVKENIKHPKVMEKKNPVVTSITDQKTPSVFKLLADQFKKHDKKVCKAKDVNKTALSGWVRIMIILFVVGLILLLVGIFLSVFIFGGFWWLFYAFGALLILAGFIILILGLLGLI